MATAEAVFGEYLRETRKARAQIEELELALMLRQKKSFEGWRDSRASDNNSVRDFHHACRDYEKAQR